MLRPAPRVLLCLPPYAGPNHAAFPGIACLVAVLAESGFETQVFDADVEAFALSNDPSLQHRDLLQEVLRDWAPNLVGVSSTTPAYPNALEFIRRLRHFYSGPLVMGGPHATAAIYSVLSHLEVDGVVVGEADRTLPCLVSALQRGGDPSSIPRLAWRRRDGTISQPHPAPPIKLATLPVPDRLLLFKAIPEPLKAYTRARYEQSFYSSIAAFPDGPVANTHATRGCSRCCPFCAPGSFWADSRTGKPCRRIRPAQHILTELQILRELEYRSVYFDEAAFPIRPSNWLKEMLVGFKRLNMTWGGAVLADEIDLTVLADCHSAGLKYLYFGLETPDPDVQCRIGKTFAADRALDIVRACRNIGIHCDLSLFFGSPGESDETVDATLEWLLRHLPEGNAFFSLAAIWPGTPWANSAGLEDHHWEPESIHQRTFPANVVWYPAELTSIDRFFSNSVGTFHPADLPVERALRIKDKIISSGFRDRFSLHARKRKE